MRYYKHSLALLLIVLLYAITSLLGKNNSVINQVFPTPTVTRSKVVSSPQFAKVTRIVDGDTIVLDTGQKVRYVGMDTPELHKPNTPVQCFAQEAMEENKKLVEGKIVRLEKDVSETDRYGRLLRYVYIDKTATEPAIFVNEYLVKEGYARILTYPPDVKFQDQFLKDEQQAQKENKGLWTKCN